LVCYGQRRALARFQGDLLGEHHVARDEMTIRSEAPSAKRLAVVTNFLDVRRYSEMDSVFFARDRPANVEVSKSIELSTLLGREPVTHQLQPARFWSISLSRASKK
jgi:hypothetical protein